jgi:putative Mn2+ efflux pump MntP
MANLINDTTQYATSHAKRVYVLAIVTSMGALMFGYDLAFIGTSIGLDPFKK